VSDRTNRKEPVSHIGVSERPLQIPSAIGNEGAVGIVSHGKPVPTRRIAADLKRSREAALANVEILEAGYYIWRSGR